MPPEPKNSGPLDIGAHSEPKQFIRTFESDSAAVKQGARPGFNEIEAAPEALVREPAPAAPLPAPLPLRDAIDIEPTTSASERLIEGSIFPSFTPEPAAPKPAAAPIPTPAAPEKAPLRTYTSDFADRIKDTKASTATVLAAEGDSGTRPTRAPQAFNVPLIAGGVLLIVLGVGGAYAAYRYVTTSAPIQIVATVATPIFVNERELMIGEGRTLRTALQASLQKTLTAGSIRLLYTASSTVIGSDVFHALQLPVPGILLRNINAEGSMAGIVNTGGESTPFFILSVSSYGDTFAGMLEWEPKMGEQLADLFPPSATSTRPFRDEVISNHDIRVLRDLTGGSIIMYGYWDPKTLLIARNESAYNELLKRLATSRTTH